jgi:hypothetical protein
MQLQLFYERADVDEKINTLIPAGAIFTFAFRNNTAPTGYPVNDSFFTR